MFGRIIDTLTAAQTAKLVPGWSSLLPQFALWVGFGAFNIGVGALVALNADRISHRRRLAVMAEFFEHVLTLPLLFHMEKHSGRALKVMSDGSLSLGGIWLTFFREHCAAFVALFVMLPLTAVLNWRLGLVLILLVSIFALLMTLVLRHTETMQQSVERYRGDLVERVSDALGNVAVIQSFTRVETEARDLRVIIDRLMAVQNPVLSWWALAAIGTRASATLTILSILGIGAYLFMQGLTTVGEIVTFVNLASLLVSRLEQVVSFINYISLEAPRLAEFFAVLDTAPALHDAPNAVTIGRAKGAVTFEGVSFSYDGKRSAVADLAYRREARGRPSRLSAPRAPANRRRSPFSIAASIRNRVASCSTAATFARSRLHRFAATSEWFSRSRCCLPARSARIFLPGSRRPPRRSSKWQSGALRRRNSSPGSRRASTPSSANGAARFRAASASGSRSRAPS